MARVPVDSLENGSVLAEDVADQSGRVLLKCGTAIQDKHLKIFKAWGVRTVVIVQEESEEQEINPEHLEQGLHHAQDLLRLNEENHELIQMLKLLIQRRYAVKLAHEEERT